MNKPLSMIIEETKLKLAEVCNEALKTGLMPVSLDLIVQSIYSEIHSMAERQVLEDKVTYLNAIKNKNIETHLTEDKNEVDE